MKATWSYVYLPVTQYQRVTDRRTDGHAAPVTYCAVAQLSAPNIYR